MIATVAAASTADRPGIAPKCKELISQFLRAKFESLLATTLSNPFPIHENNAISRYDCGKDQFRLPGFGNAQRMAVLNTKG